MITISNTIMCMLLGILSVALVAMTYLMIRNEKVFEFRMSLSSKLFDFDVSVDDFYRYLYRAKEIANKHSYDDMMFSFKPLTYEAWYDEDEIRFITRHKL